ARNVRRDLQQRRELRTDQLGNLPDLPPDVQQAFRRAVQQGVVALQHAFDEPDAAEEGSDARVLVVDALERPVERRHTVGQKDLLAADQDYLPGLRVHGRAPSRKRYHERVKLSPMAILFDKSRTGPGAVLPAAELVAEVRGGRPVRLDGVVIEGDMDLDGAEFPHRL